MCAIVGAVVEPGTVARGARLPDLADLHRLLDRVRWRGPDGRGVAVGPAVRLGHARLAIIDPAGGHQPLANEDRRLWLAFNGEIYNYRELRGRLEGHRLRTGSDGEVFLHLYEDEGPRALARLLGMYAIAVADGSGRVLLARDPLGIKPLYWGRDRQGVLWFASEIKVLLGVTDRIEAFPPGCCYLTGEGLRPFYRWPPMEARVRDAAEAVALIRERLVEAVDRCLVSDVPVGVFLSGGLDSSLVAALARRRAGPGLMSFAVGMVGSADLQMARRVAEYLGTEHHEYAYTPGEVQAVLPDVIYHLESFDVPLVRSAVATYFCARLAARHVKVVLTGEGADELFAGYHYLKEYAGDPEALAAELRQITRELHRTNLQRADRMTMAHGVEARVPFLELPVVEAAAAIDPALLLGPDGSTEKWLLRKAAEGLLPAGVVSRRKEKFSLGTGTGQFLQRLAEERVDDGALAHEGLLPDGRRVGSKEELLYWRYFRRHYAVPSVLAGMGRSRTVGDYDRNPAA